MRLNRTASLSTLAAALCLALAACTPSQPPAAEDAAPAPAVDPAPVAETGRVAALGDDLRIATPEPSWGVVVEGGDLSLSGIDAQRDLQVSTNDIADDARTVVGTDATGQVQVKVTPVGCQDTMSGAAFPFSASSAIDGGAPINGCAVPTWMPLPGEGM